MKRLVELPANERLTLRAHELVRAMGSTVESAERLQRVRRSLDAPAPSTAPRWAWRGVLAFALIGVSAAAAAGGSAWWRGSTVAQSPADEVTKTLVPARPLQVSIAASIPERASAPPRLHAPPLVANAPLRSSAVHVATPLSSDVARVHEAAKALRHDADPERALQLLERPGPRITGPLAEEALALRIEASTARGDGRQADLASAYLAQYPSGRYRALALKALTGHER